MGTVSVLVASWRRAEQLREALGGIAAQTRAPDEVLAVVRPDDLPAREVIAQSEGVREVLVHKPGIAAARVAGITAATGDVLMYLDDDAIPHPDWIARTLRHYESDATIGAVGGRDLLPYDTGKVIGVGASVGVVNRYGRYIGLHHVGSGPARDVDFLKGANMSFRRQWFPGLGPDPVLRGDGIEYHEETSISLAIKHAGYRIVYDPQILVDHNQAERIGDQRSSPAGLALFNRARNRTYLCLTYLPGSRAARYVAYSLLVGTRDRPGVGSAVRRLLSGDPPKRALRDFMTASHGHLRGLARAARA